MPAGPYLQPGQQMFPGMATRPVYREPHPIRTGPLLSGLGAASVWFALLGGIGRDLLSYAWWTIAAAVSAWLVAILLGVLGDRAVAVGVALASGLGLSIATGFVGARWITTEDWPLW
ncbi:hypothetical protein [Couchioplanes caeruleus]|uniref:Uncharacterized protein n=2 Tax=Couchioplanes caeruleus TaxID=56438 RepID=A0A1K0FAC6_9ACTN|nr:hypothetical protein [Couchioplanes caeruleus]OJF09799.1 hypothetical protein BG844_35615 [Couchioplanes caeruleus subsp. caeruleus]ROP31419.1 hypothetical protein EDD30_4319 [Couchioplanes caeruleus]